MHACDVHCTYVRSLEYHRQHRSSPWFTSPIAHWKDTHLYSHTHKYSHRSMHTHLGERCRNLLLLCGWLFFSLLYLRCKMIRARFKLCMLCMSLAHFQSPSYCSATQKFYAIPTANVKPPLLEYGFDFYFRFVDVWLFEYFSFGFALLCWFFLVVWNFSRVFGLSTSFMQP